MNNKIAVSSFVFVLLSMYGSYSYAAESIVASSPDSGQQGEKVSPAILNAAKNRAIAQRTANDFELLFGDKLPKPVACYQAATSNYIEDKWNAFASSSGCNSPEALCRDTKDNEKDLARKILLLDTKDSGGSSALHKKQAILFINIWPIAAYSIKKSQQLNALLDPERQSISFSKPILNSVPASDAIKDLSDEEKKNTLDEFNQYVASCGERKISKWAAVGEAISDDYIATIDTIKLGSQNTLMASVITHQLPTEDRGYVGCLGVLRGAEHHYEKCSDTSCANVVPADTKPDLINVLADLKMHQCDIVYTNEKLGKIDGR